MDFNVPPIGGSDRIGDVPAKPSPADERDKDFSKVLSDAGDRVDALPGAPPAELRGEIERAAERYDELRRQKRELHFATDPGSGRTVIHVRDLDGNVLRTIPPSKALDIISGEPLED
jgi:uncharacterized FlaG/YvyC family protein